MTQTSSYPKSSVSITLYDLMEAIIEEVPPGEDRLVAEVVRHLLDSGQIKSIHHLDGPEAENKYT